MWKTVKMDHSLYRYSLFASIVLMFFFGVYFLVAKIPEKPIFGNYLRSRRIMGSALLLLVANYLIHLLTELRFHQPDRAILLNLSTYYLAAWLFSTAMTVLLDKHYLSGRRFGRHMAGWTAYLALSAIVMNFPAGSWMQKAGLGSMALWFFFYGGWLAFRLIRTYRQAVRVVDDFHSENISAYIRWMSVFTYWMIIYGVGCGLLTFLPERYVFLWVLSSIPFYIYLFCSYMNYMLFYEQVEQILETGMPEVEPLSSDTGSEEPSKTFPSAYAAISHNLEAWIGSDGFTRPGLTIEELARNLGTNRTYLANYIKSVYGLSFRDYITGLRLEYAKKMLLQHSELTISQISESSGFLSLSYFTRIFTQKESYSPARWRKMKAGKELSR